MAAREMKQHRPSELPMVITAFADSDPDKPGYLAYLEEEKEKLSDLFAKAFRMDKLIHFPIAGVRSKKKMQQTIRSYGQGLTIFHYSGHASSAGLELPADLFNAENLSWYLKGYPTLKLIVLNGCSTWGFVQELVERFDHEEAPMPAILATSAPVNDDIASQFAEEFYHYLIEKDFSLQDAFRAALSNFKDHPTTKGYNIFRMHLGQKLLARLDIVPTAGTRASRPLKQQSPGNPDEPATWGLYVMNEEILKWKPFQKPEEPAAKATKLEKEIAKKTARLVSIGSSLKKLRKNIDAMMPGETKKENEKLFRTKEKECIRLEMDLNELGQSKKRVWQEKMDEKISSELSNKLHYLNYHAQKDHLSECTIPNGLGGFILQATPNCGIRALSSRVPQFLKLTETRVVSFDPTSSLQPKIWQKINRELNFFLDQPTPEAIVQAVQQSYRFDETTTKQGFLFVFYAPAEEAACLPYVERALRFWREFTQLFLQYDKGIDTQHKICLLVLDGFCKRGDKDAYSSDRKPRYQELIKTVGIEDKTEIVDIVHPISIAALKEWQKEHLVMEVLKQPDMEWVRGDPNHDLVPSIKLIVTLKINDPQYRDYAYRNYERKYLNYSFPAII